METRMLVEYEVLEASVAARSIFDMSARDGISDSQLIRLAENYMQQENLLSMVREGKIFLWGTYEKGQLIAVSGLQAEGHITLLYVLPYYQRLGIGKNLMKQMLEYAENTLHLKRVTVNAMPKSVAGYFSRMGFVPMKNNENTNAAFISMSYNLAKSYSDTGNEKRKIKEKTLIMVAAASLFLLFIVAFLIVIFTM